MRPYPVSAPRRPELGNESGAVLVEFALMLPLLMLIIVIVLEFGKAMNYWIDETHLASEGARWAAVSKTPNDPDCPGASLPEYIRCQADTPELKNGGTNSIADPLQVCIDFPEGPAVGRPVKVEVSTTYSWLPFLGDKIGSAQTTLKGSATHRLERPPTYAPGCS